MNNIAESDLILNEDGSVYHLNLLPDEIADTVILVGDQDRVAMISKYFDRIEIKKARREFVTHTGYLGNIKLSVLSTGIGTDNIDIVLNELDALANIDLDGRTVKSCHRSLTLIRIGTSGAVQSDIKTDSLLVSSAAIGLDALMNYYQHALTADCGKFLQDFISCLPTATRLLPYMSQADNKLLEKLGRDFDKGITLTAPGFYAPQGRQVRAKSSVPDLVSTVQAFRSGGQRITNIEMETAGIYGLADALGHCAISFNVILANRVTKLFSSRPAAVMDKHIRLILEKIVTNL